MNTNISSTHIDNSMHTINHDLDINPLDMRDINSNINPDQEQEPILL